MDSHYFFYGFGKDFNDSGSTILSHGLAGWRDGGWLAGQRWIYMVFHEFTLLCIDLGGISMIQGLPSSVIGWQDGGWLAGQKWIYMVFF